MKKHVPFVVYAVLLPSLSFASDSYYCAQNSAYINVGMSDSEVMAACGEPTSKQELNTPLTQRLPVTQLIYNNKGVNTSFYGPWQLPMGNMNNTANGTQGVVPPFHGINSSGVQLQINIADNKVLSSSINSNATNAVSLCNGADIETGTPAETVYSSCGTPSLTNQTFINVPIQSDTKPEVWLYQIDQYQPVLRLTFVNGKLQSIN